MVSAVRGSGQVSVCRQHGLLCYTCYNYAMPRQMHLIFRPDVQKILNSFTSLLGIRMGFFSTDGEELRVGENKPWCRYCTLLRTCLEQDLRCRESDRTRRKEARDQGALLHYECHGGLVEAIKPLFLHDRQLLGYVMIGQLRMTEAVPAKYRFLWRQRFNDEELGNAFLEVPYYQPSQLTHILELFSSLVDYILQQHMVGFHTTGSLERIVAVMEERCDIRFSLSDASHLVGKSTSRIAHLFRERYDASFKEVQAEIVLRKAEWYMRYDPDISIKEIAAAVGFRDPLYFSRFYKRKRGCAPSRVRQKPGDNLFDRNSRVPL